MRDPSRIEVGRTSADDNIDAYLNMVMRRTVNEDFAREPVNFNLEGLKKAHEFVSLGRDDVVLDIGCSSGKFVLEAAKETQTEAYIIGVDPDEEAYEVYRPLDLDTSRFTFIKGTGEDIPLPDSSVRVTTAHNVLFRATDMFKMLEEMKRVTEPGGLIIISTNARDHAFWRHFIESKTAEVTSLATSIPIKPVESPASSCYLEDLPEILARSGGLEIIDDSVVQDTEAVITPGERYDTFGLSIKLTLPAEDEIPASILSVRREIADVLIEDIVMAGIKRSEERHKSQGSLEEPYFTDTVHRGMVVCRNVK